VDPRQTSRLIDALPRGASATIDALTLANKDLTRLRARLLLVHGRDDRLIPFPESVALGRSVPPAQVRVVIVDRVLDHVDVGFSSMFSRRFWTDELPDAWRLLGVIDLLLRERDLPPPSG
jgi:hypothetical protein